jgi:hypothetical protein
MQCKWGNLIHRNEVRVTKKLCGDWREGLSSTSPVQAHPSATVLFDVIFLQWAMSPSYRSTEVILTDYVDIRLYTCGKYWQLQGDC